MVLEGGLLATTLAFWSGRVLATGTAWAGLCLIHHHHGLRARGEREARAPHFPEAGASATKGGGGEWWL